MITTWRSPTADLLWPLFACLGSLRRHSVALCILSDHCVAHRASSNAFLATVHIRTTVFSLLNPLPLFFRSIRHIQYTHFTACCLPRVLNPLLHCRLLHAFMFAPNKISETQVFSNVFWRPFHPGPKASMPQWCRACWVSIKAIES